MEVSVQLQAAAALHPRRRGKNRTNWIGGWVGPKANLDAMAMFLIWFSDDVSTA
jgi:hypothetical protein